MGLLVFSGFLAGVFFLTPPCSVGLVGLFLWVVWVWQPLSEMSVSDEGQWLGCGRCGVKHRGLLSLATEGTLNLLSRLSQAVRIRDILCIRYPGGCGGYPRGVPKGRTCNLLSRLVFQAVRIRDILCIRYPGVCGGYQGVPKGRLLPCVMSESEKYVRIMSADVRKTMIDLFYRPEKFFFKIIESISIS